MTLLCLYRQEAFLSSLPGARILARIPGPALALIQLWGTYLYLNSMQVTSDTDKRYERSAFGLRRQLLRNNY